MRGVPSDPGGFMAPHQKFWNYLAPRSVGLGGLVASWGAGISLSRSLNPPPALS